MAKQQNDLQYFQFTSSEVERLFDEMIRRPWGFCREKRGANPCIDFHQTLDALILEAGLPQ